MNASTSHMAELKNAMSATRVGLRMMDEQLTSRMPDSLAPVAVKITLGTYEYEIESRGHGKYEVLHGRASTPHISSTHIMTKQGVLRYVFGNHPVVHMVVVLYSENASVTLYQAKNFRELKNAQTLRRAARHIRDAANNPHTEYGNRILRRRFQQAAAENAALFH